MSPAGVASNKQLYSLYYYTLISSHGTKTLPKHVGQVGNLPDDFQSSGRAKLDERRVADAACQVRRMLAGLIQKLTADR